MEDPNAELLNQNEVIGQKYVIMQTSLLSECMYGASEMGIFCILRNL